MHFKNIYETELELMVELVWSHLRTPVPPRQSHDCGYNRITEPA